MNLMMEKCSCGDYTGSVRKGLLYCTKSNGNNTFFLVRITLNHCIFCWCLLWRLHGLSWTVMACLVVTLCLWSNSEKLFPEFLAHKMNSIKKIHTTICTVYTIYTSTLTLIFWALQFSIRIRWTRICWRKKICKDPYPTGNICGQI